MWTEDGGLSADLRGDLQEAASTIRERCAGGTVVCVCALFMLIYTYIHKYRYIHECVRKKNEY